MAALLFLYKRKIALNLLVVIPAKTGIHFLMNKVDPRLRGGDDETRDKLFHNM